MRFNEPSDEMDKRYRDDMADEYNRSYCQNSDANQSEDMLSGGESFNPYSGGISSISMSIGL